jgi:TolB-like protein
MKPASDDRLDSWKEIAVFLKRGIRTVQRWEANEGLPVHRHQHRKLGSVYAFESEVSVWWASRCVELQGAKHTSGDSPEREGGGRKTRLLILPFENLGGDPAQDYLADGFTEEMITQLGRLQPERLAVIARTTAMYYKGTRKRLDQIARQLDVDYVLEGSVRSVGNQVRIAAQLINAREQAHMWAHSYDRDLHDLFALQTEVAGAIAQEIDLALTPQARATLRGSSKVNPAAYADFLKGRYHLNRMTPLALGESIGWFERAIAKDAQFALAYANLSHAYALLAMVPFDVLPPRQAMPKAAAAASRALEINEKLPEAHAALAVVKHHYDWDWVGAEEAYQRALRLNPDYPGARLRYAWLLLALSRWEDALGEVQQAQASAEETDPHLLVVIRATRAAAYYFSRQYDRAIVECRDAMELDADYFLLRYLLGRAQARKGAHRQALAAMAKRSPSDGQIPLMEMGLGLAHAVGGRKTLARAALQRLQQLGKRRYIPATYIGILHAGMGDREGAFEWLEKAYEERADGLTLLNVEPMVDGLRKDARFRDLVRRIGLVAGVD